MPDIDADAAMERVKMRQLRDHYKVHIAHAGAEPYDDAKYKQSQRVLHSMYKQIYGEAMAGLVEEFVLDSGEIPSVESMRDRYLYLWRSELDEASVRAAHSPHPDEVIPAWERIHEALARMAMVDTEMNRIQVMSDSLADAMREKALDFGIDVVGTAVTCPHCGAYKPETTETRTPGFTGAPIYVMHFKCCDHQEVDASADGLEAAR